MLEKFTDRARRALQLAKQESEARGDNHIGTEHLLLGLLKEGSGVAAVVLQNLGLRLDKVRDEVELIAALPLPDAEARRLLGLPELWGTSRIIGPDFDSVAWRKHCEEIERQRAATAPVVQFREFL